MPQPKSSSKPDPPRRDPLAKLLDPLGLVVLTRELVQEAFEDAVRRGRMTRDDAQELATALLNRNRQNTEDLVSHLEQLFGRHRAPARDARKDASSPDEPKEPAPSRPRSGGSRGRPPLEDYDDLTAAQITSRLGDLTPAQLRRVRDHERRNANRKSVLQAVDRKLA
jgi:hypothetical protein